MKLVKYKSRTYVLYILSCLVIISASVTLILSIYRLQRDAGLLNRERNRDYVTNKINKSFPTITIVMSVIVCISSILGFITTLTDGRTELLLISIVSNIILGIGLIVLSVIMLGFVQNIVDNLPIDIERLLVDFIIYNKTSARDELLKIENSNDCCTTQDSTWITEYSQAPECKREKKFRLIYADQDEKRGCVKVISQRALSFTPILISETVCGCSCLLLGLWAIYFTYHLNDRYDNDNANNNVESNDGFDKQTSTTVPLTKYQQYQTSTFTPNIPSEI